MHSLQWSLMGPECQLASLPIHLWSDIEASIKTYGPFINLVTLPWTFHPIDACVNLGIHRFFIISGHCEQPSLAKDGMNSNTNKQCWTLKFLHILQKKNVFFCIPVKRFPITFLMEKHLSWFQARFSCLLLKLATPLLEKVWKGVSN